jgi:hypothetical protein
MCASHKRNKSTPAVAVAGYRIEAVPAARHAGLGVGGAQAASCKSRGGAESPLYNGNDETSAVFSLPPMLSYARIYF